MLGKRTRGSPGWFEACADKLHRLISNRNSAFHAAHKQPSCPTARANWQEARSQLQFGVRRAKSEWIMGKCAMVNDGISGIIGTKAAWDSVKTLRKGLVPPSRRATSVMMQKPDGTRATSAEENAEVFANHFEKLYGREAVYDASVIEQLPQQPVVLNLDHPPTDSEIKRALARLNNTAPGESGLAAPLWKALAETEESFAPFRSLVLQVWDTEDLPEDWETNLLGVLPKKGDLSQPGNYRGIMMLEVAYKVLAILVNERLGPIKESLDHESQNGFRSLRGTMDGIFTMKTALKKRREHGLESWIIFLDLVKAFDRVPREMLWKVLLRFGVPTKLVSLLRAMHKTVNVKFQVDGVSRTLLSIIGVKQGDVLGPDLFTFYIAAIMITWRSEHNYELPLFRSNDDFVLTGRSSTAGTAANEFSLGDSEYADDTGLLFCSRADVDEQTPRVYSHFERWGMEVHVGTADKGSKSEILFCPAPAACYTYPDVFDGVDLSNVMLPNGSHMPIVAKFPYLGSFIAWNCGDAIDVDARIASAGKAFGALRSCIFTSTSISPMAKRAVYEGIIISILLYGSECWCLTEELLQRLRTFHARCVRTMCRVTRFHTWQHHVTTQELEQRVGLDTIDAYISRRQLRWLGHMRRMSFDRLPRRMLSSWVPSARPSGCPKMTYGRSIRKALKKFNVDAETWPELASDRNAWKEMLQTGRPPPMKPAPQSLSTPPPPSPPPPPPLPEPPSLPSPPSHLPSTSVLQPVVPLSLTRPIRQAAIAANSRRCRLRHR